MKPDELKLLVACLTVIIAFGLIATNWTATVALSKERFKKQPANTDTSIDSPEGKAAKNIITFISTRTHPRELDKVFGMIQDFRVEFNGHVPDEVINKYCYKILQHKRDVRLEMIGKIIIGKQSFSTV